MAAASKVGEAWFPNISEVPLTAISIVGETDP